MLDNLKEYHIILASNSPRRRELLAGLGLDFEVRTLPGIDESYPDSLEGSHIPLYIARKKAEAYRTYLHKDELMITADTIVWLDRRVLGKPRDEAEAVQMLRDMSGRTHEVYTGVCLTTSARQRSFTVGTRVRFAQLSDEEIQYYVSHFHPLDKAGAYGVQEWIGYVGVEYIEGSYYNVMGLPMQRLYQELKLM
ncbi:Maf-like protein [Bacteroides sp. ET71]|uniref:Maf-like protein n=1 Tax=Bacteroides sp. ET71 TaxID=2939421 RepID=UPI002012445F|nr:Maf-like protein [Bacteroides sp. ET71]MCL1615820.1 Maf-like protein [Bacteroides sp. ET71]